MNNIYKVIYNRSLGVFQAVSEFTNGRVKSGSTSVKSNIATVLKPVKKTTLALSLLLVLPHGVMAADDLETGNLIVTGTSSFSGLATFSAGIISNGQNVATSDQIDALKDLKADKTALTTLENTVTANQTQVSTALSNLESKKADKTALTALENAVTANKAEIESALSDLNDTLALTDEYSGIKYFRVNSTSTDAKARGFDSVAVGPSAEAKAMKSLTIGYDAFAEQSANKGIAIGNQSQVGTKETGGLVVASEYIIGDGASSVAIGDSANARGNENIAIGKNALTTNKDAARQFSNNSIAIGTDSKTIAASNSIAFGNAATVVGSGVIADSAIAIGDNAKALDADATAIGHLALANKLGLAVGTQAKAQAAGSVALGREAVAGSEGSLAIGESAQANLWRTISIGQNAGLGQEADIVGDKNEQINIGVLAGQNIEGQVNISIGQKAGANILGKGNIALGQNAGQYMGGTNSSVGNNIAIGTNANKFDSNTDVIETTAIGFGAKASGVRAVALGKEAQSTGENSVAIGTSSQANGVSSTAIGLSAVARGPDNIALGSYSTANTLAGSGYLTGKQSSTVISVGNDNLLRRIINVADGVADQDAATVAQLKKVSDKVFNEVNTAINNISAHASSGINYDVIPRNENQNSITLSKDGKQTVIGSVAAGQKDDDAVNLAQLNQTVEENKIHYFSTKVSGDTLGNYNNNAAEGETSLAIGMNVRSTGERSVSVGNNSTAESIGGIAIGALYNGSARLDDNDAQNAIQTVAKSSTGQSFSYNTAIGAGASSEGNNSIAIGSLAKTSTKQQNNTSPDRAIAIGYFASSSDVKSTAIGDRATSSGVKANAFGSQATATGVSATAIGTISQAQAENSIAIGTNQRVTGANSGSIGYAGEFSETVQGRDIHGTYSDNATRISGSGTYSVGNTNSTVTSNESGIFGNDNIVQAKENIRIVGNDNIVTQAASVGNGTAAPTISTLKDVYITGHSNLIDTAEQRLKNSKNLFVMGAANKIGTETQNEALSITDSYIIGTNNAINISNTASEKLAPSNPVQSGQEVEDKNKVGKGFFILGNNVNATKENSVYLGTDSAYITKDTISAHSRNYTYANIDGRVYNYAGGQAAGVVTVGNDTMTRRVQGVAAGLIHKDSTDAINGSQLYAMTRPLGFAADNTVGLTNQDTVATATSGLIKRASGQAIDILGGAKDTTENNIAVLVEDTNTIKVKLAPNIDLTNEGSVKIGNTTINNNGITVNNGAGNSPVSLTTTGLDNGNNKIINVAAGEAPTDAVNVSQLKQAAAAATTKVDGDQGVSVTPAKNADGSTTYTIAAKTDGVTTTVNSEGNIAAVTTTYAPATNGTVGSAAEPNALVTAQTVAEAINNSGWNVTAGSGTDGGVVVGAQKDLINPGETVTFDAGKNMKLVQSDNSFTYSLADNITVDSLTANTVSVGPVTINSTSGIDAGNTVISNVKAGTADTDAVNVSQLNSSVAASKEVVKSDNKTVTVTTTQNTDGANVFDLSVNTGNGLEKSADGKINVKAADSTVNVSADGVKVNTTTINAGTTGTVAAGDSTSLATAETVANAINASGWNAKSGGNKADGDEADATLINPGEEVEFAAGKNLTVKRVGNAFTYATADDVNFSSIQFGDNGPKISNVGGNINVGNADGSPVKITNVATGTDDTDAVNVSQLNKAAAAAKTEVVAGTNIASVTSQTGDNGQTIYTVNANGAAVGAGSSNIEVKAVTDNATNLTTYTVDVAQDLNINSVTTGDTKMDNNGITISNGAAGQTVSLTKDGLDNGGNKITNVAAGTADTDAVNVSQLNSAVSSAKTEVVAGDNMVVTSDTGANGQAIYTVATSKDVSFNTVTVGDISIDGSTNQITGVAAGDISATSTDVVNGSQLYQTNQQVAENKANIANNAATISKGLNFGADIGSSFNRQLGETVTLTGGITDSSLLSDNNIGVVAQGGDSGTLEIKLAKDLVGLNSTSYSVSATGATSVVNGSGITITSADGNTVSLTENGLNNGGNRITNVASGVDGSDAVNVNQLRGVANYFDNKINRVDRNARAGIAGAMAAAGLPQAYLPGKSLVSLAAGTYRGESGIALGASSISDGGNWIIKGTASADSRGNFGASAGIGYQW